MPKALIRGKAMRVIWGILSFAVLLCFGEAQAQIQAPKPLYQLKTEFSEDAFVWSKAKGTGVIAGQASLVAQGGFVQYPGEKPVILIARNAYTDEIVSTSRQPGFFNTYSDVAKHPGYFQFRRVVQPDEKGRFRFENLPAGEWYIASTVIWFTRDQLGQISVHGGNVWGLITLDDGEIRNNLHLNTTTDLLE
ncbi:hypothetical protein V5T82_02495 [Magnetovibrio sp. PR-2]|uniref:hypothetical protein n=1 Tax=Magnetovibrio sp. PR-2 TaxID=3120356 RepID=UPI002FCE3C77